MPSFRPTFSLLKYFTAGIQVSISSLMNCIETMTVVLTRKNIIPSTSMRIFPDSSCAPISNQCVQIPRKKDRTQHVSTHARGARAY